MQSLVKQQMPETPNDIITLDLSERYSKSRALARKMHQLSQELQRSGKPATIDQATYQRLVAEVDEEIDALKKDDDLRATQIDQGPNTPK